MTMKTSKKKKWMTMKKSRKWELTKNPRPWKPGGRNQCLWKLVENLH